MPINAGILCGGKSAEHEVSLQSAKNIFEAIDKKKFNPILIGIDKKGKWLYRPHTCAGDFIANADDPKNIALNTDSFSAVFTPDCNGVLTITDHKGKISSIKLDVIFPILHGPYGEDGTVQGLLKLADVPFVGAGVLGSAVGMDKEIMKRLLKEAEIPIGKFVTLKCYETVPSYKEVTAIIGSPVFVKPSNMGSSVGVSKVDNEESYRAAVKQAFMYDTKIILEEFIPGREIECSVLGNEHVRASLPGEVRPAIKHSNDFYSYEAKYLDPNGAALEIPAKLNLETSKQIQDLAIKTFLALECQGLARVDIFLKQDGALMVNEINTMPGFTRISMYPKLWEATSIKDGGISYTELITTLIELALSRYNKEKKLKTSYISSE